jgi:hypothetical protein
MQRCGRPVLHARTVRRSPEAFAIIDPVRFAISLAGALLLAGCGGERKSETPEKPASPAVKVTQFYANPPIVPKGGKALLCYGVESAATVRIEPPVEQLGPALTRCFEIKPADTTTYKLIAEGRAGGRAESTATVTVGAAQPVLFDLAINSTKVKAGELVSFCFQTRNASSVSGGPGRFQHGGKVSKDCLIDQPTRTTTYKLVATNADGLTDSASMTVEVR